MVEYEKKYDMAQESVRVYSILLDRYEKGLISYEEKSDFLKTYANESGIDAIELEDLSTKYLLVRDVVSAITANEQGSKSKKELTEIISVKAKQANMDISEMTQYALEKIKKGNHQ